MATIAVTKAEAMSIARFWLMSRLIAAKGSVMTAAQARSPGLIGTDLPLASSR